MNESVRSGPRIAAPFITDGPVIASKAANSPRQPAALLCAEWTAASTGAATDPRPQGTLGETWYIFGARAVKLNIPSILVGEMNTVEFPNRLPWPTDDTATTGGNSLYFQKSPGARLSLDQFQADVENAPGDSKSQVRKVTVSADYYAIPTRGALPPYRFAEENERKDGQDQVRGWVEDIVDGEGNLVASVYGEWSSLGGAGGVSSTLCIHQVCLQQPRPGEADHRVKNGTRGTKGRANWLSAAVSRLEQDSGLYFISGLVNRYHQVP